MISNILTGGGKISLPKITIPKVTLPSVHLVGHSTDKADYIKDGLVFWLDGIDKGGEDGKWVDLVGGIGFGLNGNLVTGNSVNLAKIMVGTQDAINWGQERSTIEVCFNITNGLVGINQIVFEPGAQRMVSFQAWPNQCVIYNSNEGLCGFDVPLELQRLQTYSISMARAVAIVNGTNLTATKSNPWRVQYSLRINPLKTLSFHSIRIYDRLLSEAEMRHNQEVDRKRFKLTFPEPIMTLEYEEDDYEGDCEGEELREGYGVEG